ncbi:pyrimidine 5-nucleotidase [Mollisia scopiformis]|uniref:Pyrimidine 5-nucleotidase n=1 Tax=Mollisia scopiformis TaxID=149040 RepID=A0A194XAP0_MOLSC|nr:pyrimidine 5-nucleotidase [Mollisia scopiformis]KUJ16827.1 pyrimidine 5-nucleotidase [Mollisia scopiformis]
MTESKRPVFFFDIDNCLYSKSKKVHDHMTELIDQYFVKHLELTQEDAFKLHQEYYKTYGLAIEGLVRHHKIDPLEYNRQVDDAIPLETILFPDPTLRKLLEDIDKSKVKLWLFTNAYVTHGKRVVKLLGVEDMFEGLTFCDYAQPKMICKPYPEMYAKGMKEAGVEEYKDCYFVDDSFQNCRKAEELGWTAAHLVEEGEPLPAAKACKHQIRHLEELRTLFPQFFKTS